MGAGELTFLTYLTSHAVSPRQSYLVTNTYVYGLCA
jgi:hypothetical protein